MGARPPPILFCLAPHRWRIRIFRLYQRTIITVANIAVRSAFVIPIAGTIPVLATLIRACNRDWMRSASKKTTTTTTSQHGPVNAHDSTPPKVIFCSAHQFRAFSIAPAAWQYSPRSAARLFLREQLGNECPLCPRKRTSHQVVGGGVSG
jgi:hypothetical protein